MTQSEDRHVIALQSFVLRARRIRAHSIAQDAELLTRLQNPQMTVHVTPATGETRVVMELPPEEQVESAAARVRPLILNDEDTYHAKVMNALLHFAKKSGAPESGLKSLRTMKKEWATVDPKGKSLGLYEVRLQQPGQSETRITDNALAFSWIYGDVVHADSSRREEGQAYGVAERFRAAVPVVARLMILAMVTLSLIERLKANGVLPDLGDVFEEEVVVSDTSFEVEATVYVAEYDENGQLPEPPAADEEFGGQWKPFSEVFNDIIPKPSQAIGNESMDASLPAS